MKRSRLLLRIKSIATIQIKLSLGSRLIENIQRNLKSNAVISIQEVLVDLYMTNLEVNFNEQLFTTSLNRRTSQCLRELILIHYILTKWNKV